MKVQESGDKL